MRELGVTTHPDYKVCCMLDHMAMVTVQHPKHGECLHVYVCVCVFWGGESGAGCTEDGFG